MISSAVIVPDANDLSPQSPTQKRPRSSSSQGNQQKRPRLQSSETEVASHDAAPASATSISSSSSHKKTNITKDRSAEERKRGQRLFGALLGTLSQSSNTTTKTRRADIEKKQLDKLQKRKQEAEEDRKRKRERLDAIRRKELVVWNRESTKMRHENLLAEAHFLKTNTEPPLFYKPWELRPEEADQIRHQINDAQEKIRSESTIHDTDFSEGLNADQAPKRSEEQIVPPNRDVDSSDPHSTRDEDEEVPWGRDEGKAASVEHKDKTTDTITEPTTHSSSNTNDNQAEGTLQATQAEERRPGSPDHYQQHDKKTSPLPTEDHGGEELVEGQEDDVIY